MVLASRFISCAIKSSLRPIPPSSFKQLFAWSIWLLKRTVSSSTQILSAYKITSAAILFSSNGFSPRSSVTFCSNLPRYSFIICGLRASIKSTSPAILSSLSSKSFFKCSPSVMRAATNCSHAAHTAFSIKCHSSSSSTLTSSVVMTSGYLESAETVISLSR